MVDPPSTAPPPPSRLLPPHNSTTFLPSDTPHSQPPPVALRPAGPSFPVPRALPQSPVILACPCEMLKALFEYVLHAWKAVLEDPDDDVRVVVVDTLIPVAASLVRLNDQMLNSVVMSLWDILLDLNDISPCTSSVMNLLAQIYSQPEMVPIMLGMAALRESEFDLPWVAEEVIFGQGNVTTRASSDFMHVSRVARQMVERFGLMYPFW
ncbi:modifier of transcription 1-D1 [Hordeum vulgare]|nr:modifier of transcription 1-D1 [Hordeum vulgare]